MNMYKQLCLTTLILFFIFVNIISGQTLSGKQSFKYPGVLGELQEIEVIYPKGHKQGKKASCLVFFHGGGWTGGGIGQGMLFCPYFAERGMVTVNADYSRWGSPESKLKYKSKKTPPVIDGKYVVRWVKKNSKKLGVDPEKIVVVGVSAGSHIGVLSMFDNKYNHPEDDLSINTDVAAFALFGSAIATPEMERDREVNIFDHLDRKKFPPMLFISGENDGWMKGVRPFIEALKSRKVDLEVWLGMGEGHMFFKTQDWLTPSLVKMDQFLVKIKLISGPTKLKASAEHKTLEKFN